MSARSLSRREWRLLMAVAVLASAGGLLYGVIRPVTERLRDTQAQLAGEEVQFIRDRRLLREEEAASARSQSLLESYRLDGDEDAVVSRFSGDVQQAAQDKEIHINSFKPVIERRQAREVELAIDIQMEAADERLWAWLHALQSPPLWLRVTDLQIRPLAQDSGRVQGRLVLKRLLISASRAEDRP